MFINVIKRNNDCFPRTGVVLQKISEGNFWTRGAMPVFTNRLPALATTSLWTHGAREVLRTSAAPAALRRPKQSNPMIGRTGNRTPSLCLAKAASYRSTMRPKLSLAKAASPSDREAGWRCDGASAPAAYRSTMRP